MIDPETRREIEALLPFAANNTLTPGERARVEAALAEDEGLRREFEALQAVRDHMQAEEMDAPPGELGVARLMRALGGGRPDAVPVARLRIWQAAAVAFLAVSLGQFVITRPETSLPTPERAAEPAVPREEEAPAAAPLAIQEAAPRAAADLGVAPPVIEVRLAPDLTEARLRAILREAGVELAGGPAEDGTYRLSLLPGTDADAARAVLRAAPEITLTAP